MKHTANKFPVQDRYSYFWLAVAFALTIFSTGKLSIPLLAWVSTIFALRFTRTFRWSFGGYLILSVVIAISTAISWHGMIPMPSPRDVIFFVIIGFTASLPFLADRLLAGRIRGLWATLVFPLASTAFEFMNMGGGSSVGSFGATGYTQYDNLILLQIVSVTGMWGLSFLMAWLASMVNWAWEQSWEWPVFRRGVLLYGFMMMLVLIYGGARLNFAKLKQGTVRVASFTAVPLDISGLMGMLKSDREAFRERTRKDHAKYFEKTISEAQSGAKIVLWPEGAGICLEEDEQDLMDRAAKISDREDIYLAIPFFTMYNDPDRPPENKLIIFDPVGEQVLEHVKYGGNIFEGSKPGDGILKTVETPYGTLSGVVCWDTDFIGNIGQSGRNGTDILLSPAHDWPEIDPLHGQMSAFRAIENGISVIRQSDGGFSVVTDPYGRTLAAMDHYTATDRTMIAQVPVKGVRTVYSMIGNLFGWLAVAGLLAVILVVIIGRRKRKEQ